jgi:hypothetical protein
MAAAAVGDSQSLSLQGIQLYTTETLEKQTAKVWAVTLL